jgi:hypothetical protein
MTRLAMFAILAVFIMGILNSIRSSAPSQPRTSPARQRPEYRPPRPKPRRPISRRLPGETAPTIPQFPPQMPAPSQSSGPLRPVSRDESERGIERVSPVGVSAPIPQWSQDSVPKSECQLPSPSVPVPRWHPEPGPEAGGADRTQALHMPFPAPAGTRSLKGQAMVRGGGWQMFGSRGTVDRARDQQRESLPAGWHRFGQADTEKSQRSRPEPRQAGSRDGRNARRHLIGGWKITRSDMERMIRARSRSGRGSAFPGTPYAIVSGPACPCRPLVMNPPPLERVPLWPREGRKGGLPR